MKKNTSKTEYIQPSVKVVAFKVEVGLMGSDPEQEDGMAHTDNLREGGPYEGEGYFNYGF